MRLRFAGAATTVTGSQFLLETDQARIVVDCGMFQGSPSEVARNRLPFAYEPASVDAVLLTHAHLDHCGMLPALVKAGFGGPIFATKATTRLTELVLLDSAKLQVEEAKRARKRHDRDQRRALAAAAEAEGTATVATGDGGSDSEEVAAELETSVDPEEDLRRQPPVVDTREESLYDIPDAEQAVRQFRGIDYDAAIEVAPGIRATFRDAGHILGSAVIVVDAEEAGRTRRLVFSGDLGRPDTPIIRDPTPITDGADYVLVESTYGGREHDPTDEAIRGLADTVRAVADITGVLMIPAFSIGRTQEIVWYLDRLLEEGRIPRVPLYLDSPMATRATDIYHDFPGYYDVETAGLTREGETPLDYPEQHITRSAAESKAIATAPRPLMIVASSGMLSGGRIVHHLQRHLGDERAILLFVGYQGEGTLGRHLQDGATHARINGQDLEVRCQVRSISGFSAHADESELLDWLRHFAGARRKPRRIFLVHGDPEASAALEPRVRELGLEAYRPRWREIVELD
jgi:metallo-beta-lactamase family protein